jgi:hypothetical protein
MNLATFADQKRELKYSVWFEGSTAVRKGMGLCYDIDTADTGTGETATDPWGRRGNVVAVPSNANNMRFAGVATQSYAAKTGGQRIDIFLPGSICLVEVGLPSTIYSQAAGTIHTCSANSADTGRFTLQGLPGRGTAVALETQAAAAGGNVPFASLDGTATTAWVDPSLTITKAGIGTACGYGDDDIDPTEFLVVILGGADNTTGGDSSGEMAVTGEYAVVTAPSADTVTIATDIGDVDATLYVIKNTYPTVLCELQDGVESGLQETISPQDNVAAQNMVGGTTFICFGYTVTADSTSTLADGIENGQKKLFAVLGTSGGQDWVLTVTSGIDGMDGGACGTVTFDTIGDYLLMEWCGVFTGGILGQWIATNWVAVGIS